MSSVSSLRSVSRDFATLNKNIESMNESLEENTEQVRDINKRIDEVRIKEQAEINNKDWAKVEPIKRRQLVKDSAPVLQTEPMVILKRLDII